MRKKGMDKITEKEIKSRYRRDGIYLIDAVIPFVSELRTVKIYNNHEVKMNSERYHTFKNNLKCVTCGLEGIHFALEQNLHNKNNTYHFNLYAITSENEEVLMTKDHIVPISKGGKNNISNYQTMCIKCNTEKGNKI